MYGRQKKPRKQSEDKIIKAIKGRIVGDIRSLFEQEEDYYKPVRVGNFYSTNYIKYESNSDRNKSLSIMEFFEEIKLCLNF